MDKSTISMAMFNSYVTNYQRVILGWLWIGCELERDFYGIWWIWLSQEQRVKDMSPCSCSNEPGSGSFIHHHVPSHHRFCMLLSFKIDKVHWNRESSNHLLGPQWPNDVGKTMPINHPPVITIKKRWYGYHSQMDGLWHCFSHNIQLQPFWLNNTTVAFQQLSFPALAQPVHASSELPWAARLNPWSQVFLNVPSIQKIPRCSTHIHHALEIINKSSLGGRAA